MDFNAWLEISGHASRPLRSTARSMRGIPSGLAASRGLDFIGSKVRRRLIVSLTIQRMMC